MLCLITGILEFEYDPEPERTLWKRRQAQRLAASSNLGKEGKPFTKAMGDDPNEAMKDYCGKVSIKQEPEWTPPHNNNSSEGIFWDDLADLDMESLGDNFSDVSKPCREDSWKPMIPYSARRIRKIEYQKNVVREWLHQSGTVFVEDYTNVGCNDETVDAMIRELEGNQKCMALKDKKRKHSEKEADGESRERLAKRLQLPPKKEDPGSVTM